MNGAPDEEQGFRHFSFPVEWSRSTNWLTQQPTGAGPNNGHRAIGKRRSDWINRIFPIVPITMALSRLSNHNIINIQIMQCLSVWSIVINVECINETTLIVLSVHDILGRNQFAVAFLFLLLLLLSPVDVVLILLLCVLWIIELLSKCVVAENSRWCRLSFVICVWADDAAEEVPFNLHFSIGWMRAKTKQKKKKIRRSKKTS